MQTPTHYIPRGAAVGAFLALGVFAASCGTDDGATVRELGGSDAEASASASAPAEDSVVSEDASADGGYRYASNVSSHRLVVLDICGVGELLDAGDFDAVRTVYTDGVNSVQADGTLRTIGGFATSENRNHGLDQYYGSPTPLDDFVTSALDGTGVFDGESDAVRAQGVEKGMQNQTMVAWTIHELGSATAKADDGDFDIADGAVHNWDEAWAFYHGAQPGCAPHVTADKRAANFGTVAADDETALANEAILAAMIEGRDALVAEDTDGAKAAAAEVARNVVITYSQAAVRYASLVEDDLAAGDQEGARVHQAEGFAFWRVIEAIIAAEGGDAAAVNAVLDLANAPGVNGDGATVRQALEPAWTALGISADDIGRLEG